MRVGDFLLYVLRHVSCQQQEVFQPGSIQFVDLDLDFLLFVIDVSTVEVRMGHDKDS